MFKDIREDVAKIKSKLKQKAILSSQIDLKTKQIIRDLFGEKSLFYIKGIYPKKNELIIEVNNNIFASEIQMNLGLIKQRIAGFEKISVRII